MENFLRDAKKHEDRLRADLREGGRVFVILPETETQYFVLVV